MGGRVTLGFTEPAAAFDLSPGSSILETAHQNNIEINATCGGRGRCRSCRVKLVQGAQPDATIADQSQLSDEEIQEGFRLACQCFPDADTSVAIAPPINETSFQILVETEGSGGSERPAPDSGISKVFVPPDAATTDSDRTSELDALLGSAGNSAGLSLDLARLIPELRKNSPDGLTVTRFAG